MILVFYISLTIVLISILLAIKNRNKISIAIRFFAGGIFLALLIMTYAKNASSSLVNFFTVLQIGTLDADYGEVFSNLLDYESAFVLFYSVLAIFAPIVLGGTLFSFFDVVMQPLSFKLLRKRRDCYIFTELNKNSYLLALSIVKNTKKSLIAFVNAKENDENLIQNVKQQGFLFFNATEKDFIFNSKYKRYYFSISENESENLSISLKILDNYINQKKGKDDFSSVKIFLKSEQEETELIFNKINKKNLEVIIINQSQSIANILLYEFPMYNVLNREEKLLDVLIVGGGKTGRAILKNVLIYGQLGSDYRLKVKLIDKDADYVKSVMSKECPEFNNKNYEIEYFNADIRTNELIKVLDEQCKTCNYIVVCLQTDELSIQTALYLKKYYASKNIHELKIPMVVTRIMDEVKSENLKLKTFNSSKELLSFGTDANLFSFENLLDNPLDKLALNVHSSYCKISKNIIDRKEIIKNYYKNETNRKSDKSNAIHIPYKLFTMGFSIKPEYLATKEEIENSDKLLTELKSYLSNKNFEEQIGCMEHNRWMAFQSSDGWEGASFEEALEYSRFTNSHKYEEAKLHACICSWEDLEIIQNHFDSKLKEYDIEIIKQIPNILGLTKAPDVNISNVKYVLFRK